MDVVNSSFKILYLTLNVVPRYELVIGLWLDGIPRLAFN